MTEATQQIQATETEAPADMMAVAREVWGEDAEAPVVEDKPEGDKPADAAPPTEEKPAPVEDSIAKRLAVAKRAELRTTQERQQVKTEREAIARERAELEAAKARYKLLEEDPVKAFEELKLDPKTFLEKLSGEYKPESVLERQLRAVQEELAAIKSERTKEIETAKERQQRQESEAKWEQASQGFVTYVGQTADKYPHLVAEYTESEAVDAAYAAMMELVTLDTGDQVTRAEAYKAQFGEYPENDVIAEYLDAQAKQRAEARQNSAWRKQIAATSASQALPSGDPNLKSPPAIRGSSPRTLTSRAASEKATIASNEWSQEAADEESLRILRSKGFR